MDTVISAIWRSRCAGLLRLRRADIPIFLECLGGECGLCCSVMGGDVVIQENELQQLPSGSLRARGDVIVLKSTSGRCTLLKNNRCSYYEGRPRGCREYPWYKINGEVYYDRGCPGMSTGHDGRPAVGDLSPIEVYLSVAPIVQRTLVWIFTHW